MLIEHLADKFPDFMTNVPAIDDLQKFYKESKKRFDDEEDFKERSRARVVKLQAYDPESIAAWKVVVQVSRDNFQKIYNRLRISLTEKGESYYNDMIAPLIEELEQQG
jgi:arginyl-tRNA synthetase